MLPIVASGGHYGWERRPTTTPFRKQGGSTAITPADWLEGSTSKDGENAAEGKEEKDAICHIRCMRVNEHGMRWCTVYNKCIWEYVWIPWVKFASRPRYWQFTITVTVIFCWAPASAAPCPQHGAIGGLAAWPLMSDFNHKRSHILRPEASGYSSQQLKRGRKTRLLNCSAYPHVTLIEVRPPTNCCTEACTPRCLPAVFYPGDENWFFYMQFR